MGGMELSSAERQEAGLEAQQKWAQSAELLQQGDFVGAETSLERFLKLIRLIGGKHTMEAQALRRLGQAREGQSSEEKAEAAVDAYEKSLEVAHKVLEEDASATKSLVQPALSCLCNCLWKKQDYTAYLKRANELRKIVEEEGDKKMLAQLMSLVGVANKQLERPPEAVKALETALSLYQELEDNAGFERASGQMLPILLDFAEKLEKDGKTSQSLSNYRRALELRPPGDKQRAAKTEIHIRTRISNVHWRAKEYEGYCTEAERLVELGTQSGEADMVARLQQNLGVANYELGNRNEAMVLWKAAREYFISVGNSEMDRALLQNLGRVAQELGDTGSLTNSLTEQAEKFLADGDEVGAAETFLRLAREYYNTDEHKDKGIEQAKSSLSMALKHDNMELIKNASLSLVTMHVEMHVWAGCHLPDVTSALEKMEQGGELDGATRLCRATAFGMTQQAEKLNNEVKRNEVLLKTAERFYKAARMLEQQGDMSSAADVYRDTITTYAQAQAVDLQEEPLRRLLGLKGHTLEPSTAAFAHRTLADILSSRCDPKAAPPVTDEEIEQVASERRAASAAYRSAGKAAHALMQLREVAKLCRRLERWDRAIVSVQSVIEDIQKYPPEDKHEEHTELGLCEQEIAAIYQQTKNTEDVIKALERATQHFENGENFRKAAECLKSISNEYTKLGRKKDSKDLLLRAVDLDNLANERDGGTGETNASTLVEMGQACMMSNDFEGSREKFEAARQQAQKEGNRSLELQAVAALASTANNTARLQEALELFNEAISIALELGERKKIGELYFQLGSLEVVCGDTKSAIEKQQKALQIAVEQSDTLAEGRVMGALGNSYLSIAEYARAKEYFEKQLRVAEQQDEKDIMCTSRGNLGNVCMSLKQIDEAAMHHEKALSLAKELDDPGEEARALGNMGNIYFVQKAYDKALECNKRTYDLSMQYKNKLAAGRALGNMGNIYSAMDMFDRAVELHNEFLEIAIEVGDKSGQGTALCNLGELMFKQKNFNEARRMHMMHLDIAKSLGDPDGEGKALQGIARVQQELDNLQGRYRAMSGQGKSARGKTLRGYLERSDSRKRGRKDAAFIEALEQQMRWAAERGNLEMVRKVISKDGVFIDAMGENQYTALHIAAAAGHLEVVRLLSNERADVNCETDAYETPYQLALLHGQNHVASYLKDVVGVVPFVKAHIFESVQTKRRSGPEGADFRTFSDFHRLAWHGNVTDDLSMHQKEDPYGRTTLMMAAFRGHPEWVRQCLEKDPTTAAIRDKDGWSALHWCCSGVNTDDFPGSADEVKEIVEEKLVESAKLLINAVPEHINMTSLGGETPLALAYNQGNRKLARHLLSQGAGQLSIIFWFTRYFAFFILALVYNLILPTFVVASYIKNRRITRILGRLPQVVAMVFLGNLGSKESTESTIEEQRQQSEQKEEEAKKQQEEEDAARARGELKSFAARRAAAAARRKRNRGLAKFRNLERSVAIERRLALCSGIGVGMLWLVPIFLVYVAMPSQRDDPDTAKKFATLGIGFYMMIVAAFLGVTLYKAVTEKEMHTVRHPQPKIRWEHGNFTEASRASYTAFRIAILVYDFFCFANFTMPNDVKAMFGEDEKDEPESLRFMKQFTKGTVFSFDSLFAYSFWVSCLLVVVWFMVSAYLSTSMLVLQITSLRQLFPFIKSDFFAIPGLNIMLPTLSVAFLPICSTFFQALDCSYGVKLGEDGEFDPGDYILLDSDKLVHCWQGSHLFYAAVGMLYMIYYIPSYVVVGIYFLEPDDDFCDVRYTGAYMLVEQCLKWLLSGISTFFTETTLAQLLVSSAATGLLAFLNHRWTPCKHIWAINHYRTWSYVLLSCSALVSTAGIICGKLELTEKKGTIWRLYSLDLQLWLAVGIVIVIVVISYALIKHYLVSREEKLVIREKQKEAEEQRRFTEALSIGGPGSRRTVGRGAGGLSMNPLGKEAIATASNGQGGGAGDLEMQPQPQKSIEKRKSALGESVNPLFDGEAQLPRHRLTLSESVPP
eukprot:CAMPEP_0170140244 /NCGR_PEP_ID=MMETSP0033_2-20121228/6229_1 /TAXON_ID=195969 /ORGANISM="Dolichomastix tenuilepis, Strain CCMP3274" /LENGTH=2010 /DNA_ID=CAMNT_0010376445 /DNA_START=16 /DNA_END=6048 /DNA_ORIENTATION=-